MAARPTASGIVSFGLVSIPVKLFTVEDTSRKVRFNFLSKDGRRVRQQYVAADTGEPQQRSELRKGYEFERGRYVVFTADELKAVEGRADGMIDIKEFVDAAEVDRIHVEKTWYLGPAPASARAYHILRLAMLRTGKAALAEYSPRGRSHLVLVRPHGEGLALEQLRWAQDLRSLQEVPIDPAEPTEAEVGMAVDLVERLAAGFEPERYSDSHRERMLEAVRRKVEGEDVLEMGDPCLSDGKGLETPIDIMAAMRATAEELARKPAH